jgi:protein-disulfide isomerase
MENNSQWVDDRLRALDPPSAWKPDAAAALPKLRERETRYRTRRLRWIWSAMAAALFFLAILLTPARCAFGVCRNSGEAGPPEAVFPAAAPPPETAVPFKESGDPRAPLTCEIFTDYQCPHCAAVFDQIVPMLLVEYVQTGKMKFVHRDMPLAMHQYARLAARYANAAGWVGRYEGVVNQIFRTQAIWTRTGDLDSQVAQVVQPDEMEKIRDMVKNDAHLDNSVTADWAIAKQDGLNQTPSLVVTHKGKRQVLAPIPAYPLLKSYLDELLTK